MSMNRKVKRGNALHPVQGPWNGPETANVVHPVHGPAEPALNGNQTSVSAGQHRGGGRDRV
jgi:hypothetical protein